MKKKIYIAVSDPSISSFLSDIFKSRNENEYELHFFNDGLELYNAVRESTPDVLIVSIMLPLLSGIAVTRLLKFSSDVPDFPIIIVSSYITPDIEKNISNVKADAFIKSPFNENDIFNLIERIAMRELSKT